MTYHDVGQDLPGVVSEEFTTASAALRATHHGETSGLQRFVDRLTAVVARPAFVAGLGMAVIGWIAGNLVVVRFGLAPLDPPPFAWLQCAASAGALLVAALILTTQRREDELADHRAQLILELTISNDQKVSKVIELLEEVRRDNPAILNRIDTEATAMSTPSDTRAVLDAIKDRREDFG
jgi:uncharacterized membrane protein